MLAAGAPWPGSQRLPGPGRSIVFVRPSDGQIRPSPLATEFSEPGRGPAESLLILERQSQVREALNTLKPEQREVLEIAYFSGLTHVEIARHLGLPLGTVKTRIRTGMMQLRGHLSESGGGL